MSRKRINIITLGCSKNLVDTERVLSMLSKAGYEAVHQEPVKKGDIVIINTCGFIGDAKEESINTILEYLQGKENGEIDRVYVMGCLSQRYRADLEQELPDVDGWYGKFNFAEIVADLTGKSNPIVTIDRTVTTPPHYTYLKIAEGCNRFCAFCAIPLITGRFKSRTESELVDEVKMLVDRGVKEFNVIAQDLSSYGLDIDGTMRLPQLIDKIAGINGVEWIRLHYAYPAQFPMEVMDVMAAHDNVCNYMDIALQHASDKVLKNMRRHITADETRALIAEMRRRVPGLHLRTTLMTGFPGEGEREFEELMQFVKDMRFERMGAFAYCEEDDTYAARNYTDSIPQEVKQERLDALMELQEGISMEIQQEKTGKILRTIIDREEAEYYVGRTEWDSPEVDPEVLVKKTELLKPGEFYNIHIDEALPFELIGTKSAK
ncbi:MAG: 30S ribosomal protein S12 methylthiotransferase RimO [Muribaculaceae bacterium]|nr:30S ribosomal protein S12 methylthiotransferase RimO [Muribaculaceae bacterium]